VGGRSAPVAGWCGGRLRQIRARFRSRPGLLSVSCVGPAPHPGDWEYRVLNSHAYYGLESEKGQIVNLRYFVGLTVRETAAALGLSVSTVEREWRYIRAWLKRVLPVLLERALVRESKSLQIVPANASIHILTAHEAGIPSSAMRLRMLQANRASTA